MQDGGTIYCDFCGKSQHQVSKIVAHASQGMIHAICSECVTTCVHVLLGGKPMAAPPRAMLPGDIGVQA